MKTIRYLGILLVCSLLMAVSPAMAADSYFPSSIVVTQGTQIDGDVGSLSTNDAAYLQVNEVNLGTELDRNPNEQWLVSGTQEFGSFSACVETKGDSAYCSYWEEDDDLGALTGDSYLLTPTGAGTYTQWGGTQPVGAHWQMVDDDPPHDANATYITDAQQFWILDMYEMEDIVSFALGTKEAGSVTAFSWVLEDMTVTSYTNITVRTHGTLYDGVAIILTKEYVNDTWVMFANLNTYLDWTLAEINAMEVGVAGKGVGVGDIRCSSVGAVVPTQYLNYVLNIQQNFTTLPTGADYYNLTITGNRAADTENVNIQVYDYVAPGWNTRATINSNSDADYTYTLTSDEVSTNAARIRFVDAAGDTTQTNLSLDWVNIHATYLNYTATIDLWYSQVNVLPNTQGALILVGYRDGDTEAITLQVFRGGSWTQIGADVFTAVRTMNTYPIDVADIVGSSLLLRVTDAVPTDGTQTEIYLDYAELIVKEQGGVGSPVFPDYEAEYNWWSGDLNLYDNSFSLAGDITTWNWRVDGDYAGDNPEIHIEKYPSWFDVGQHKVEVRLEVTDEMGYAAVEFGYVWVDNGPRLIVLAAIFLLSALVLLLVAIRVRLVEKFRNHRRSVKFKTAKRKDHDKNEKNRIPRVR